MRKISLQTDRVPPSPDPPGPPADPRVRRICGTAALIAAVLVFGAWSAVGVLSDSPRCETGLYGCLLVGIVAITVGPVVLMLLGWLAGRLLHVPRAFLVTVATGVSCFALVQALQGVTPLLLGSRLFATAVAALLAAGWAWLLVPGRPAHLPASALLVVVAIIVAAQIGQQVSRYQQQRQDIQSTGVDRLVRLDDPSWTYVSNMEYGSGVMLIYDSAPDATRRLVLTVADLPRMFAPVHRCSAATAGLLESEVATPSCERVAPDMWRVKKGRSVRYLARVHGARVLIEELGRTRLAQSQATRIVKHLRPASSDELIR